MNRVLREAAIARESRDAFFDRYDDERIAHLMRLCARGFNRSLTRRLAEHGVSFGHWVFLRILWKEEGLTQRQLSERANLTEPTAHTALNKLEQQGIVTRRNESGNRRKQHVYLTPQGKALKDVLEPLAIEANQTALEGLDPEAEAVLKSALIHVMYNLAVDEAEAEARGQRVPPTRGGTE